MEAGPAESKARVPGGAWGRRDASALVVAAVSVVVQAAYLVDSADDPTFAVPIVDAGVYHDAAVRFASGQRLIDDAFWQPPLFPLLLGCLYRIAGPQVLVARIVLAVVATGSCLLIWWIGRRVFSRRVGVVAGLLAACYGPFVFFSTQLLPTGLAVFLDLAALSVWIHGIGRPRWYGWWIFGLLVGLATITVANAVVLLAIALIGLVLSGATRRRVRGVNGCLMACAAIVAGAGIPVGAVAVRNRVVSGEWVILSTNAGINFYIGNNPHSNETLAIRPGEHWQRLARESHRARAGTRARQSGYFWKRGLAYVADHPLVFLRDIGRKTLHLVNAREIPRNVDPYAHRAFSTVLGVLLWRLGPFGFPFGLIAPLAVVGVVVSLASDRIRAFGAATLVQRAGRWTLLAFIVVYGASIVVFFVSSRYRVPVAMVMIPFAAAGAVWMWDQLRGRDQSVTPKHVRMGAVSGFMVAAAVVNLPIRAPTDGVNFRAEMAMCVGHTYAARGDFDRAEAYLRDALTEDSHYAAAAAGLADVLVRTGRVDEAEALLREAVTWPDGSADTRRLLAQVLHVRGATDEAVFWFEEALRIDPTSPEAHSGLADVLVQAGRIDEGVAHYREAAALMEAPGPVLIRLGDALAQQGQYEEAIERYRQGLWLIEPEPAALNRVAWLLATCPVVELRDCERAVEIAEHLCQVTDYRHPVAMDTLAAAYAECGRLSDAAKWVRRAIDTAFADGDSGLADSFRPRLEIYERRLSARPP